MANEVIQGVRICSQCILPETFPGISFDDQGVCSYCRREEKRLSKSRERKADYRARLDRLIASVKGKPPLYDAIMAYSGGKDSSYAMKLLKEQYDLRILSVTFDNHFVSPMAWRNIRTVTDYLESDHIRLRPSWPNVKALFSLTAKKDIFPPATLLRASAICTACIGIVKSVVLRMALEMDIPLVAFGWSPGQAPIQSAIMKTNPSLIRQNQAVLRNALTKELQEGLSGYFIPDSYYGKFKDKFPHNIHPLAFFDYNEDVIKEEMKGIGWEAPDDTDTNSTNCLLNAFANHCHMERHGYHPYVHEIASMVRQGVMDRPEGIEKIYSGQNQAMINYAREMLGL
jgi:tRNA(Ile)-lysidine synthase TilS/MesJ